MEPMKHFKTVLLFHVQITDAAGKTGTFCICYISKLMQNLAEEKTGHCLTHLNKSACVTWSCFGNIQLYPKISNTLFPPNPSVAH